MSRTAPIISLAKRMLSVGTTRGQQVDPGLVVDAGVEEHVAQQVLLELRLAERHREPAEATPVVGHRAAAVRDDELQVGEVAEQIALEQLHEGRGVGVQVVVAGGVERRACTRC